MGDWGPVVIAVVLFVLLTPGLLCQIPGRGRVVEFRTMQTSGAAIFVHTIIYFALITILLLAVGVHIYTGLGKWRTGKGNDLDHLLAMNMYVISEKSRAKTITLQWIEENIKRTLYKLGFGVKLLGDLKML